MKRNTPILNIFHRKDDKANTQPVSIDKLLEAALEYEWYPISMSIAEAMKEEKDYGPEAVIDMTDLYIYQPTAKEFGLTLPDAGVTFLLEFYYNFDTNTVKNIWFDCEALGLKGEITSEDVKYFIKDVAETWITSEED